MCGWDNGRCSDAVRGGLTTRVACSAATKVACAVAFCAESRQPAFVVKGTSKRRPGGVSHPRRLLAMLAHASAPSGRSFRSVQDSGPPCDTRARETFH